jgi:hypothetical protein
MKKFLALLLAIAFIAIATAPWGSSAQNKGNERVGKINLKFRKVEKPILDQYIVVLKMTFRLPKSPPALPA